MKANVVGLAKLTPPQISQVLERARLFNEIDRLRQQHRIIWIQGPPGAGKTTLVASYLKARMSKPLWYQVDQGDADPGTWFHYLGLGMKQVASQYKKPLPSLSSEYLPGISVFTRRFFEQLYGRLKTPGVVVFDNYQEVPEEAIFHDLMNMALSTIPENTTVFVISRRYPPVSVARLQAEECLTIIDPGALALTLDETEALLRLRRRSTEKMDQFRSAEILYDRTKGWFAGMVLLLAQPEHESLALPSTGTQEVAPVVFDYFASQVFQTLTPQRQEFLLQTAFLSSLTVLMAEQVTDDLKAKQYLSDLARSQYFTVRHAGDQPFYQYHPLFQEFLRTRIQEDWKAGDIRTLKLRSASVLEQANRFEDAIALFVEVEEKEDVVRLILRYAPLFFAQGRYQTVAIWLSKLPSHVIVSNPWIRYWDANCKFVKMPQESIKDFERLTYDFEKTGDVPGMLLAWCGVIDSIFFTFNQLSDLDVWVDYVLKWLNEDASFPSAELEVRVSFTLFNALMWSRLGDDKTLEWQDRGEALLNDVSDVSQRILLSYNVWHYWSWMGEIQKSVDTLNRMEMWAASTEVSPLARMMLLNARATIGWISGEGRQSIAAFIQAKEILYSHGLFNLRHTVYAEGIAAAVLLKDYRQGTLLLEEIRPLSEQSQGAQGALYYSHLGWVTAAQGNCQAARDHSYRAVKLIVAATKNLFLEALVRWKYCHILIEAGKLQEAEEQLARNLTIQRKLNSRTVGYMIAVLEAQFALAQGQRQQFRTAIEKALIFSRETGFVFAMGSLPNVLSRLYAVALEENIEIEQVRFVIQKVELVPEEPLLTNDSWPWPVRIYTLGRFVLMGEIGAMPFGRKVPKAPLALLKLLIAYGGKEVSQSQVMDWLWPDADGDAAYRSLKMTLSRLRKLLKREEAILFTGGTLSINSEVCWVDSLSFQSIVQQSNLEAKHGNLAKSAELGERARALYQGELLPHDADSWVLPARDKLEQAYTSLVDQLGAHHITKHALRNEIL